MSRQGLQVKRTALLVLPLLLSMALHAATVSGESAAIRGAVFDIRDFGASGDAVTVNTAAIQKAIDACTASGGGQVLVAGGRFVYPAMRRGQ
jgi:polygalacturonase